MPHFAFQVFMNDKSNIGLDKSNLILKERGTRLRRMKVMMERDEDEGNDDEDDGFLFFLEEDSENMSQQDVTDDYAFLF